MASLHSCVTLSLVLAACITWSQADFIPTSEVRAALENYDTNRPPKLDGPTNIRIGVYMNNLLLHYDTAIMRMNIYLRMSWQDPRLIKLFKNADDSVKTVLLDDKSVQTVWRPDLFARNADGSERVDALVTEHLFRVNRTGYAWYVVRMINNMYCPAVFSGQRHIQCPMMFESFSHTMKTLTLSFLDNPVDIDPHVHLRSHTLGDFVLHDCSQNYTAGAFPCLEIRIHMDRDIAESTFDCGVYLVSILLVIISWLGFWIPPSDKRIFLGLLVTLILSVLYLAVAEWREFSFGDRTTHAQIWVTFCLVLVLGMVFEFAAVYILCGTLRARLRGLCGGTAQPDELEAKRSKCGDVIDTVFGLVLFPAIFVLALIAFGSTSLAFK